MYHVSQKSKKHNYGLSPKESLLGIFGFALGLILSIFPFQADAKFKTALQTKALDKMMQSLETFGISAFHSEIVIDAASSNNFQQQTYEVANKLVKKYPREFLGWKALYYDPVSSSAERSNALRKLRELDPYNPEFK